MSSSSVSSSSSTPASLSRPLPSTVSRQQYLILYNLVSALLWLVVLGRVVSLTYLVGYDNIHGGIGDFAKWTQTLAILEIVHSALGQY